MKKILLTSNNEEIKFGDTIRKKEEHSLLCGVNLVLITDIVVTKQNLAELCSMGIVRVQEIQNIDFYLNKLRSRLKLDNSTFDIVLKAMYDNQKQMLYTALLKEIALCKDNNYDDHIRNAEHIWIISSATGNIARISPQYINSFKTFAAFRSYEDAADAINILADLHSSLYAK